MATLTIGAQSGHPWQAFPTQQAQRVMGSQPQTRQHPHATAVSPYLLSPALRPRNDVDLSRDRLVTLLNHFSQLLAVPFNNRPFRLVVHGGACMLLHPMIYQLSLDQHHYLPELPHRTSTRDVDYIHRSFITEMTQLGVPNAAGKLQECILATARHFNLGADWMNSDADVALPMATGPSGITYDPIYSASVQPNNIDLHTIYHSPNGMLTLISVTPFWAVSLKLVRYSPQDAADICLLLRNGTKLSGTKWSFETLREWLFANCWPMGYSAYDRLRLHKLNERLQHAIQMMNQWVEKDKANPKRVTDESSWWSSVNVAFSPPRNNHVSPLAAMGGGEIIGGEHGQGGWIATWPQAPHGASYANGKRSNSNSPQADSSSSPRDLSDDLYYPPPVPHFHDAADFSLISQTQDSVAAAKRAKKKAKARKSISVPRQASSPPPLQAYGSRPNSPWRHQPGQPGPGLSSLRDLDQSLGQMLHSQYAQPPQVAVGPYVQPWRRAEKPKKSKDKRNKGKERERQKERDKGRISKWIVPREHPSPEVEAYESESESDTESESESSDEENGDDAYGQGYRSHPEGLASRSMYASQQGHPNGHLQSYSHPAQPYGPIPPPQSRPQPPPIPQTHFIPPIPPPQPPKDRPPPLDLSPTPRPQGLPPQSQFLSTYPGMQSHGPAPGAPPTQMLSVGHSLKPHSRGPSPLPATQGHASMTMPAPSFFDSKAKPQQQEEPFIPPPPEVYQHQPPPPPQQQQQLYAQPHHPLQYPQDTQYSYQYQHQHRQSQSQPLQQRNSHSGNSFNGLY